MKERPILFSGAMVRAILDGRKTQTRRAVSRLNRMGKVTEFQPSTTPGYDWAWRDRGMRWNEVDDARLRQQFCPYGVPGDRLWVRETWADVHPIAVQEGRYSVQGRAGIPGPPPVHYRTIYRADGEARPHWRNKSHQHPYFTADEADADPIYRQHMSPKEFAGWTPSIHMPRWASRLTLEITDVRVQRLQDITEADVVDEGVSTAGPFAVHHFMDLWNSINGTGAWNANPWVWALTFKRVLP